MKRPVTTLLKEKGSTVYSVSPDVTIEHTVHEMNRLKIGAMLVLDRGSLVGIFTERDVLRKVVEHGTDPKTTKISEVMTTGIRTAPPNTSIEDAMAVMTNHRHRHLPIVEDGELVGLVSLGDITRWIIQLTQSEAEHLRNYITGSYPS